MTTVELARDRTLSPTRILWTPDAPAQPRHPTDGRAKGRTTDGSGLPPQPSVWTDVSGACADRVDRSLLLITLTFGSTSDWCRNVLEAGGCRVKLRGGGVLRVRASGR